MVLLGSSLLLPLPRPPSLCTVHLTARFLTDCSVVGLCPLSLGLLEVVFRNPLFLVTTRTTRSHCAHRGAYLRCTFAFRLL